MAPQKSALNEMVPTAFLWSWHVLPASMWVSSGYSGFLSIKKMHPGSSFDQRADKHLDLVCQHLTKASHCYAEDDGSNAANKLYFTLVILSFPFSSFLFFPFLSFPFQVSNHINQVSTLLRGC